MNDPFPFTHRGEERGREREKRKKKKRKKEKNKVEKEENMNFYRSKTHQNKKYESNAESNNGGKTQTT